MKQLKEAVRQAISEHNWYCALAGALILPDICSSLDKPEMMTKVKERYVGWYNSYVIENYTGIGGSFNEEEYVFDASKTIIFLSGEDCYALRCAYLHNGLDEITEQRARESLNKFRFVTPPESGEQSKHPQKTITFYDDRREVLQLEVDKFCEGICSGVDKWEANVETVSSIQDKLGELLTIY